MGRYALNMEKYADLARTASAEGCVLLKNDNSTLPLKKGDKVLSFLPLAHAYGCAFDFLTATAVGTHVTLLGKTPSPKIIMKAFEEVKPNLIITVPLVIEKIYKNICCIRNIFNSNNIGLFFA